MYAPQHPVCCKHDSPQHTDAGMSYSFTPEAGRGASRGDVVPECVEAFTWSHSNVIRLRSGNGTFFSAHCSWAHVVLDTPEFIEATTVAAEARLSGLVESVAIALGREIAASRNIKKLSFSRADDTPSTATAAAAFVQCVCECIGARPTCAVASVSIAGAFRKSWDGAYPLHSIVSNPRINALRLADFSCSERHTDDFLAILEGGVLTDLSVDVADEERHNRPHGEAHGITVVAHAISRCKGLLALHVQARVFDDDILKLLGAVSDAHSNGGAMRAITIDGRTTGQAAEERAVAPDLVDFNHVFSRLPPSLERLDIASAGISPLTVERIVSHARGAVGLRSLSVSGYVAHQDASLVAIIDAAIALLRTDGCRVTVLRLMPHNSAGLADADAKARFARAVGLYGRLQKTDVRSSTPGDWFDAEIKLSIARAKHTADGQPVEQLLERMDIN